MTAFMYFKPFSGSSYILILQPCDRNYAVDLREMRHDRTQMIHVVYLYSDGDHRLIVLDLTGVEHMDEDTHIGQLSGNVRKEASAIITDDLQGALERLVYLLFPARFDPALGLFALGEVLGNVGA
jgi:hypothetical protein